MGEANNIRHSGSRSRDRYGTIIPQDAVDTGLQSNPFGPTMKIAMIDSQHGAKLRQRFGDILGHDGLVTRLGEALGPNLAAGRKKVTRWFNGDREPPEEIWHLLEVLEATPKVHWPERWKNAVLRQVKVGRPMDLKHNRKT